MVHRHTKARPGTVDSQTSVICLAPVTLPPCNASKIFIVTTGAMGLLAAVLVHGMFVYCAQNRLRYHVAQLRLISLGRPCQEGTAGRAPFGRRNCSGRRCSRPL